MERRTKLCAYHWMVLSQYLEDLFTRHYPREIIQIIICLYYNLFKIKIKCSLSYNHYMILFDGEIYSWGNNYFGELGLGFFGKTIDIPTKINLPHITKIACGMDFSLAVDQNNILYGWGNNHNSELGLGKKPAKTIDTVHEQINTANYKVNIPRIISKNFFIKKIIGSRAHSMILTSSGDIYGWGQNACRQLNLNTRDDITLPHKLNFTNIDKLVGEDYYSIALSTSNELFCWGSGIDTFSITDFIKEYSFLPNINDIVCQNRYCAIVIGDDIYFKGSFPSKLTFPNLKKLTCSCTHFMVLSKFGEVYVQDWNTYDHLESAINMDSLEKVCLPPIKKIVCGDNISFAISKSNDIYTWRYRSEPKKLIF
jgi:alpha-tubulin suppressor-like RCC1 family protein